MMQGNNYGPETGVLHDDECESLVIGTLLAQTGAIDQSREILDEDCFYNSKYQEVYKAILKVDSRGEDISIISVYAEMQKGKTELTPFDVTNMSSKSLVYEYYQYAVRLAELSMKRKIHNIGYYLVSSGSNECEDVSEILSKARESLDKINDKKTDQYINLNDSIKTVYDRIKSNLSDNREITGTPTGFHQIDDKGGLQKGNFIVIAAETSQGKTSFAQSVTLNALDYGSKIAYYSLEMQNYELTSRLISMRSEVCSSGLLYDKLGDEQLMKVNDAINKLWDKNLYYDDRSTSNIDIIISSIRNMKKKFDIDGAVVDYIQILNVNRNNRNTTDEQLMGDVARRFKNLAKELGIWIMALSQLSRDKDNTVPSLSRLRSSGQIAEAADIVILIYRPEAYDKKYPEPFCNYDTNGTAMINIAKGRNIGIGKFICRFKASCTYFYEDRNIGSYHDNSNKSNQPF